MPREVITSSELRLPFCGIPRPKDRVSWYQGAIKIGGELIGHRSKGTPYVLSDFEESLEFSSFDYIRLEDPQDRVGPNWEYLPTNSLIFRPYEEETNKFREILDQAIPPGPKYIDLITEIWSRGYEVFVVGGAVRDVIGRAPIRDIDLVTTMPLATAEPLLKSMYGVNFAVREDAFSKGELRFGGFDGSGDAFVDLSIFKHLLMDDVNVTFSNGFVRDVDHRDFACNAVYYDPINNAYIDPTGHGIQDVENKVLNLVCNRKIRNSYHIGCVVMRFFRFLFQGYTATNACTEQIIKDIEVCLTAVEKSIRVGLVRSHIIGNCPKNECLQRFEVFRANFLLFGSIDLWNRLFEPFREEI